MKKKKVFGDIKKFTIVRKNWYRGKGSETSCLVNNQNKLCCLGFYAEACGLARKTIRNIETPREVVALTDNVWDTKLVIVNSWQSFNNSKTCEKMIDINDNEHISDEDREKRLTKQFSSIGIKV